MEKLFLSVVEVGLGTSFVILALLLLTPVTAKFLKRKFRYFAWLILALRLCIPFSITQTPVINVEIPSREIVVVTNQTQTTPEITPPVTDNVVKDTKNEVTQSPNVYIKPSEEIKPQENAKTIPVIKVLEIVYLIGAAFTFLFQLLAYLKFSYSTRRFDVAVEDERILLAVDEVSKELGINKRVKIFKNAKVDSPLLIGFFSPAILIPKKIENESDIFMILRHELMHLKRYDTWYKLLLSFSCAVHWFNPLVWIMKKVADDDLENACDEDIVKNHDENFRHPYCESILRVIRAQKSREPIFTAGFSSKPGDIKARFLRILDMTKKRGGKTALAVLLCLSIICTAFIGCEVAGDIIDTVSGENDVVLSSELEKIVKKELGQKISQDPEMLASLYDEYAYETIEAVDEITCRRDIERTLANNGEKEYEVVINKYSLLKLELESGIKKIVLMKHDKGYYHENGTITSETVDYLSYYPVNVKDFSEYKLNGAKLVATQGGIVAGAYLPESDSFLMGLYDTNLYLVEVKGQNKENPLFITQTHNFADGVKFLKNYNDQFVIATNLKNENFFAFYDNKNGTITPFGTTPLVDTGFSEYVNAINDEIIAVSCEDGLYFFNLNSETPYTPFSKITGENVGEGKIIPMREVANDRNKENNYVMAYQEANENYLGFVVFDEKGAVKNSFNFKDMKIDGADDLYTPILEDNVMYFTHMTDGYLCRMFKKYAVDVRVGTDKTPQLMNESKGDENNISLEEFNYEVDSIAYPFTLGDTTKVLMYDSIYLGDNMETASVRYWISGIEYNAKTRHLKALATANMSYEENLRLSGKLVESNGKFYFRPDDPRVLPKPYDDISIYEQFPLIKLATDDEEAFYEYITALNLDYENVTIGFDKMLIEREKDKPVTYTVELKEIFNGSADFFENRELALNILKTFGLVNDGKYEIVKGVGTEYVKSPILYTSAFSLLKSTNIDTPYNFLGWCVYQNEKEAFESLSISDMNRNANRFRREYEIKHDDVKALVEKYFYFDAETLKSYSGYDASTNTYAVDFTDDWYLMNLSKVTTLSTNRIGDTLEMAMYVENTRTSHYLKVKLLENGEYKFVEHSENFSKFSIPESFKSELF